MPRSRIQNVLRQFLQPKRMGIIAIAFGFVIAMVLTRPASAAVAYRGVGTGSNASATSVVLNTPTGAVVNDVMIAVVAVRGGTAVTGVSSPGWTSINTTASGTTSGVRSATFYKVVTSSEPATHTFTFAPATAQKASGVIVAYSGVDTADPINISGIQANASSATMTAPSITTTVPNTMVVALYSAAIGATVTVGSSMNLRGQASATGNPTSGQSTAAIQDVIQAGAAATGTKTATIGTAAVNIGHLIALRPMPTVSQVNYRFFQNTDSTTASTPYAAAGTPPTIADATPFRLRLNLGVGAGSPTVTNTAARTFTLQYALRGSDGVCDSSFANEIYSNVTSASTVRFYDNTTPADGAAYVTSANDPTRSGVTAVGQKYEEVNPIVLGANVLAGQDALWDISLITSGATAGQTYCLRVLDSNNATLLSGGYSSMPEFNLPQPTLTQANYRWLANVDSLTPGAALANQDTAVSISPSTVLRLRQRIAIGNVGFPASSGSLKMQYAEKVGTCDAGFSGESYGDVNNVTVSSQALDAGSATTDGSYGTRLWANPNQALTNDSAYAEANSKSTTPASTNYLVSSNHGFSIPANAIIRGIQVSGVYTEQLPAMPGFGTVSDSSIRLVKAGTIQGADRVSNNEWVGAQAWGGATDLWGTTWSPSDINNPGFGAAISASISSDNTNLTYARVDNIKITVYYSSASSNAFDYYNNPSAVDGGAISSTVDDPTNGARPTVLQTYQKNDPFTNKNAVANGSDGLWDFSLIPNASAAGKSYCFRFVKSTGALLDTYSQIPEATVTASGPTLDQQMRGGQSVVNTKAGFTW